MTYKNRALAVYGVSEIPQLGIVHASKQRYTRVYNDDTQNSKPNTKQL